MVKCPGAGFIAFNFGIGLSALIVATSLSLPGHTQSADLVLCDRIAADPSDPDKPADVKGTPRNRSVRYRDGNQILQKRVGVVAPRNVRTWTSLRGQSADV